MMKKESHKRSMSRSLIWRVLGVIVLALVTFYYTGNIIPTALITFFHHFAFIWIYYGHERVWNQFPQIQGKKRKLLRMFTYEIILGNCVLGTISLIFTGSWTTVTLITITYIGNKLWMYVGYDWLWDKVNWGAK